jgi:nitrate reductase NapD
MQTQTDNEQFDMTGVVVHAHPDKSQAVVDHLTTLPGVEVHGQSKEGKLVVTIEELHGEKIAVDTLTTISNVPGVLSTSLIFHHSEDTTPPQEKMQ